MTRRRPRLRDDEGSTLPLIAVFTALAIAVVLVVTAASSLYLERKRLLAVADAAALAGAESFDPSKMTAADPTRLHLNLDDHDVRRAAEHYLADSTLTPFVGLELVAAEALDDQSASVTLASIWRPPIAAFILPDGVRVEVTGTARSVFE